MRRLAFQRSYVLSIAFLTPVSSLAVFFRSLLPMMYVVYAGTDVVAFIQYDSMRLISLACLLHAYGHLLQ